LVIFVLKQKNRATESAPCESTWLYSAPPASCIAISVTAAIDLFHKPCQACVLCRPTKESFEGSTAALVVPGYDESFSWSSATSAASTSSWLRWPLPCPVSRGCQGPPPSL